MTDIQAHAQSFGPVAAQYEAARPSYPAELFDRVERLLGRPLKDADVLDVGAGTGIATRLLAARGARVVALEPSAGMAEQLRLVSPEIPVVKGVGDELPFHDGMFDLVCYAQAFHWTDPAKSIPEAVRVLRPGGRLAVWWNVKDRAADWVQAQEHRLAAALPSYHYYGGVIAGSDSLTEAGLAVEHVTLHWERRITVESHLTDLVSRSYFAVLAEAQREPVLAAERVALLADHPDGVLTEPYRLDVFVAGLR